MEMKAIVILYEGSTPTKKQLEAMLERATFVEDSTRVKVETLNFSKMCGILASSVKPSGSTITEDGDAAVVYLAGMCRDIKNIGKLSIDIIKGLNGYERGETDIAFVNACSYLAQGYPVSPDTAKKYGFTTNTRNIIKQLYNAWHE